MKLSTAAPLALFAAAASPASASSPFAPEKGLRALNQNAKCSLYHFDGLWEGVDPMTGAIHNTEFSCAKDDSWHGGDMCEVTTVISYHEVCDGKTILEGKINDNGQFEKCSTDGICLMPVTCANGKTPPSVIVNVNGQDEVVTLTMIPVVFSQNDETYRIQSYAYFRTGDPEQQFEAYDVTLNKIGGGWWGTHPM